MRQVGPQLPVNMTIADPSVSLPEGNANMYRAFRVHGLRKQGPQFDPDCDVPVLAP